ncbi:MULTISPECIES: hypothetical protein [Micromonospora]|uniref:Uncharacterized protein n=1 Tax=Micromonospora solifontis TaxID=2487138 RepID=A0ABX9WMU7_9ACTN|nr:MULTISPECIES: hypothetical protein [Micromonospora]NES12925.1 hypothetical protein [Micromonospora sp. PPF5-17B]NES34757.1 hypothetical protein [Micromonospora solifontis]NES54850.1 hypothetical protein [Micromonospora sp. PPF5-6]RNM01660.1 hypothetical protein EFE23_01040 [Micromonospora solifontis]
MSQPPTGAGGYPPQPPGGTVYGSPYGGGQPAPQQYGPAQPEPTMPQPTVPQATPPVPGQYPPATAPSPGQYAPGAAPAPGQYAPGAAPVSSPGTAPVSAPGYPQPLSAPPMSAPPVSGPGFGPQPMSGPPGPVPPYGAPAAGAGKGRTTLILAVVAGLLFILGGVMTGLYVSTNGKLDKAEKQVSQQSGTITANQQEIDKLKADLQSVQDKLSDTQQDLTGTKNDRDEQARQKKVIASCLDKLTTALRAASRGDKAGFDAASKGMDKVCDEADNYL